MKISELIEKLGNVKDRCGDIPVFSLNDQQDRINCISPEVVLSKVTKGCIYSLWDQCDGDPDHAERILIL